jgi:DNA repair exonuclease SbcCD ATPase subunit
MQEYGVTFERFRAFNAYPFKKIDIDLKKRGLVRMAGKNGTGKSSTFNLFTQVCQGSGTNAAKKSDMMFTDKDFLLEVTFQKNGSQYVAAHATKSKEKSPTGDPYSSGVYLFRDGTDISMHRDPDTVKLIRSTLGWSIEEWYGYVLLAQSTIHTLINGTRSERQNYLSALFNLTPLDALASHFKSKAEEMSDEIAKIEVDKQTLSIQQATLTNYKHPDLLAAEEVELADSKKMLESMIEKAQAKQDLHRRSLILKQKIKDTQPDSDADEELVQLRLTDAEAAVKADSFNRDLKATLSRELQGLTAPQQIQMPSEWKPEYADSPDIDLAQSQKEVARLQSLGMGAHAAMPIAVALPEDFETIMASPDINEVSIRQQVAVIKSRPLPPAVARPTDEQIKASNDLLVETVYQIRDVEGSIKKLEFNEAQCPTCGSELDCKEREVNLAKQREELVDLKEQEQVLRNKRNRLDDALKLWLQYDSLGPDRSSELPELESSLETYAKKKQYVAIKRDFDAYVKACEIAEQVKELEPLKLKIKIYEMKKLYQKMREQTAAIQVYEQTREKLIAQIAAIPDPVRPTAANDVVLYQQKLRKIQTRKDLEKELQELGETSDQTEKIAEFNKERDEITNRLSAIKSEKESYVRIQNIINELQSRIALADQKVRDQKRFTLLAKAYGKAGSLRELQLAKFSKYLEDALFTHTIRQLPEHRFHFKVDDGIDILAEYIGTAKPKVDPYDIKLMSGGEKGALSVAFLFALDDLLPPSRRTSLKIIDEIEAGFDSERQQDFMQFTLPELRKRADTVVVISHSQAANNGVFDCVWEIKDGTLLDVTQDAREFEGAG